ncbi:hypothetical protein VTO73DRAFT_10223 [Trametes versicolor]
MVDSAAAAYLVDYYRTTLVEKSSMAGMLALMLYELAITFDREAKFFWNMPFSRTTAIFLLNRYSSLLKYPVSMVSYRSTVSETRYACNALVRAGQTLEIIPYFVWAMFSAMRIRAITERNIMLFSLVFVLLCVPVGTNLYLFAISVPDTVVLILTRASAILGDAIVIGVTWFKTFRGWRAAVDANMRVSLSEMILRDGSIYFLVFLCLNVLHVVMALATTFSGIIAAYEEPLSSIMVSRLMLNLREVDQFARDAAADECTLQFDRATLPMLRESSASRSWVVAHDDSRKQRLRFCSSVRLGIRAECSFFDESGNSSKSL